MKIYTITLQHTYIVEADSKQEALESIIPTEYSEEELIDVQWVEPLDKPTVI